ncbi:hypothetical protein JXA85_04485 [Candidatus Woesearchaeota archaeon]|nr:hypothetical protein [Candidatus Woesearchaeota archaeon]
MTRKLRHNAVADKMKKTSAGFFISGILIVFLLIVVLGCSSKSNDSIRTRQMGPSEEWRSDGQFRKRTMNISDDEMQQRFEELQKLAQEACSGKEEGNECSVENQRGTMSGECKTTEGKLLCTFGRPERSVRQDETN